MSYKTGDLKRTAPQCGHPACEGDSGCVYDGTRFWVGDARSPLGSLDDIYEKHGVYLPHSCDEWFIGGRAEVEAMIADLTAALEVLP